MIFDQYHTPQSRAFLDQFKHTEYFDYRYEAADYREIEELFLQGKAKVAVVMPASFARDLAAGRETPRPDPAWTGPTRTPPDRRWGTPPG